MRFAFFTRNQGNRDSISNDKIRCATMDAAEGVERRGPS